MLFRPKFQYPRRHRTGSAEQQQRISENVSMCKKRFWKTKQENSYRLTLLVFSFRRPKHPEIPRQSAIYNVPQLNKSEEPLPLSTTVAIVKIFCNSHLLRWLPRLWQRQPTEENGYRDSFQDQFTQNQGELYSSGVISITRILTSANNMKIRVESTQAMGSFRLAWRQ